MHRLSLLLPLTRLQAIRLFSSLRWSAAYFTRMGIFQVLVLTFVTYFLMSAANSTHSLRFEDINEALSANKISLMGLGAALFMGLIRALQPLTTTTFEEIFTPRRFEKQVIPGFVHGALLAAGVTLAFLLSGNYRYLGFFIQFDGASITVLAVVVRILALGAFAYLEEFIFRQKITQDIQRQFWGNQPPGLFGTLTLSLAVAGIYLTIKWLQFDLGIMQMVTLSLISIGLSIRARTEGDFGRGAGFWAAILIVFQPLLSLPLLGGDFSGLLLIKYQSVEESDTFTRIITGGAGGPLSSAALQIISALDIIRGMARLKKRLSNRSSSPLRS